MLAFRIALAGAAAVLAAPAAAFATNAHGATPSATPLLLELVAAVAVAVSLVARRRVTRLARAGWSQLAQWRASRRVARPARISGR